MRANRLPAAETENISEAAATTARTLLDAYYYQDKRESAIVQADADAAATAAAAALGNMAEVFEREFPARPRAKARYAGKEFMRGLFVQDEIENHHLISGLPQREFDDVLLSDPTTTQRNPATDDRWDTVRNHLTETCTTVQIHDEYSQLQARFWLLHGQLNEYWEDVAKQAHALKLDAMIEQVSTETQETLGSYFVAGVKRHDDWTHRDKETDYADLESIVARYYQTIFDLQGD